MMEKIKLEPFQIIGISVRTTNANQQAAKDIVELWHQFWKENLLSQIPNKVDDTIYSLYTDYESDHTKPYTTIIGCRVTSLDIVPEGMVGKSFDGGNYIRTTARGDLSKGLSVNHWAEIWNSNLERIFTVDFEVYGQKAQDPANAEIDFFVAVE